MNPKRMTLWDRALLALLVVGLTMGAFPPQGAQAATLIVTKTEDTNDGTCDSDCSLREALAAAAAGDTIVFAPALADQTITLTSQLQIETPLTIDGSSLSAHVKISGNHTTRVFLVTANATATLTHLDILNGQAFNGAGFLVMPGSHLTLNDCVVSGNVATLSGAGGGGLYVSGGAATINRSVFANNVAQTTAGGGGGGLYLIATSSVTVTDSLFADNLTGYAGGGVYSEGDSILTVYRSTFSGNVALYGGAIGNKATLYLTNSTLSGNANTDSTWGGSALDLWGDNVATINHCTIVSNTANVASDQSGILLEAGTLYLLNSIIAYHNNTHNFRHTGGTFISQGYNLANAWNGLSLQATDLTGDPLLDALADNGGPTPTHALRSGSPAIDAANPTGAPATDQRGLSRPQDGDGDGQARSDIGAFELPLPLRLRKSVTPATDVAYHGVVTYTLALSNDGAVSDTLRLTDTLPAQVTFARWLENPGASVLNNEITWSGVLTAHTALTFTFQVTHTGSYGDGITNTAEFRGSAQHGDSVATFTVVAPQVTLGKTAAPDAAPHHGLVTYTLVLSNTGPVSDPAVILTDTLPAQVTFARWLENPGASVLNNEITWSGALTAHTPLTFTFQVTHTGGYGETVVNTARFSGMMQTGAATASFVVGCASLVTVQNTADSGPGSLRQALMDVCSGGTVDFAPALAGQTIVFSQQMSLDKEVTVDGSGLSAHAQLSGNDATRLLAIGGVSVTLRGLDLVHGYVNLSGGSAIYNEGTLTLYDATLSHHRNNWVGGAIQNLGHLTLYNVTFANNETDWSGGAIHNQGTLTVYNSTFTANRASIGGGVSNLGTMTAWDSLFASNTARSGYSPGGGGLYNYNGHVLTLTRCVIRDNTATNGNGGGLYNADSSTATVIQSVIRNNVAAGDSAGGGGLYNLGNLTVDTSILSGNAAGWDGGGLNNAAGETTLKNSTLTGNSAGHGGGLRNSALLTLQNSTLSGNSVRYNGGGGYNNGSLTTQHCTFWGNAAGGSGGGIFNYNNLLRNQNTLIAGSVTGGDCVNNGGTVTGGHNLVQDGSCAADFSGDPLLGPLQDNGGPGAGSGQAILTHALLPGSPALDQGDAATCLATDQRGVTRPQGVGCDIGALEQGPLHLTKTATPDTDAPYHGLITYTLVLSNSGALAAPGVWLSDTLPAEVDFARWLENPGASVLNDRLAWSGVLTAHTALTFTFQVTHTGSYGESVVNTAILGDAFQRVSAAAAFTTETPWLTLSKTVWPDEDAPYHGVVTYTLRLENSGVTTDPAVILSDTLPAQVTFARWLENPGASVLNDQLTWSGVLTAHTALTFTFRVTHTGGYGEEISNQAYFSGTVQSDSDSAYFDIASPHLRIAKTVTPSTVVPYHGLVTYTVTLRNTGLEDDPMAVLTDALPAEVDFARWLENPGASVLNDKITWNGALASGAALTFTFQVTHTGEYGDRVENTAHSVGAANDSHAAAEFTVECGPTFTVRTTADSGPGSLRHALTSVCPGGVVTFAPALAGQTITLTTEIEIERAVTLDGSALSDPVTISGNDATRLFAIGSTAAVTMTHLNLVHGRTDYGYGGAIYNSGGLTLQALHFADNQSGYYGGAVYNDYSRLWVSDSEFIRNRAGYGGAIVSQRGTAVIARSTFISNTATSGGGGFSGYYGNATLTDCTFAHNQGGYYGGGVYLYDTIATVTHSAFAQNLVDAYGGGLASYYGALQVSHSTFYSNATTAGSYGYGGGLYLTGLLTVTHSAFVGNAAYYGGGILKEGGALTMRNSTLSGNTATNVGGGLCNWGGPVTFNHSTFWGNTAGVEGGGLYNNYGDLYYYNTLIAASAPQDCVQYSGAIVANVNNLVQDGSCAAAFSGDPLLGPLQDNGGATLTHALLPGSPAIDAGDAATCLATDQRDVTRPQGAACDIGAYEATPLLTLAKRVTPASAVPYHGLVTYTLVLGNSGVISDPAVILTDMLPAEVDFARWLENPGAGVDHDLITWSGALTTATTLTFTFQVTHTGGYGESVVNTAMFSGTLQTAGAAATFTTEGRRFLYLPLVFRNVGP